MMLEWTEGYRSNVYNTKNILLIGVLDAFLPKIKHVHKQLKQ